MNPRAQRAHQPDLHPDPLDDPRHDPPTDFEVDFFEEYGLSWAGEVRCGQEFAEASEESTTVASPADARRAA